MCEHAHVRSGERGVVQVQRKAKYKVAGWRTLTLNYVNFTQNFTPEPQTSSSAEMWGCETKSGKVYRFHCEREAGLQGCTKDGNIHSQSCNFGEYEWGLSIQV